jgi:hypothetical protein
VAHSRAATSDTAIPLEDRSDLSIFAAAPIAPTSDATAASPCVVEEVASAAVPGVAAAVPGAAVAVPDAVEDGRSGPVEVVGRLRSPKRYRKQ